MNGRNSKKRRDLLFFLEIRTRAVVKKTGFSAPVVTATEWAQGRSVSGSDRFESATDQICFFKFRDGFERQFLHNGKNSFYRRDFGVIFM